MDSLTTEDYEEVITDHKRLVRKIDVIINGEDGAAQQASLCDLVGQIRELVKNQQPPQANNEALENSERWIKDICRDYYDGDRPSDKDIEAIETIRAALSQNQWRDISSAPKDGTCILVWHKDYSYGAGVSYWSDVYSQFMVGKDRPQPTIWCELKQPKPPQGGE